MRRQSGEVWVHVEAQREPRLREWEEQLGCDFAHQRVRRGADPYEVALRVRVTLEGERRFDEMVARVMGALGGSLGSAWGMNIAYYPPGQSGALYHVECGPGRLLKHQAEPRG